MNRRECRSCGYGVASTEASCSLREDGIEQQQTGLRDHEDGVPRAFLDSYLVADDLCSSGLAAVGRRDMGHVKISGHRAQAFLGLRKD